jgi:hypothetical protein
MPAGVHRSPAPGRIRIWRADADGLPFDVEDAFLLCLLGPERPKPIRGYGGWGQSSRTGRRARSRFDGSETPAYSIQLLLENDAVPTAGGLAGKLRTLDVLTGGPGTGDDGPPPLKWAAHIRHDNDHSPRREWVCESVEFGDDSSDDDGRLRWQIVTLVLAIYRDSELDLPASKGFDRRELHKTQDLRDFARKWLGDPKRWDDVAELNRDNPRCPRGPHKKPKRPVTLLVPLREPASKSDKRKRD